MANKKLKVELELETAKAKRQLGEMGNGSPGGPSGPSSTRSADRLTEATSLNTKQMIAMTRAFSGMAIGLAASYSSRYFKQGSTAETAIAYGGSILSGASAGAMMGAAGGPVGMAVGGAVGGVIGTLKEYFDRESARKETTEDYRKSEANLEGNENFANMLKRISSPHNQESIGVKLATLADQYDYYLKLIDMIKGSIEGLLDDGRLDEAKKQMTYLQMARSRKNAIMDLGEKMDNSATGPKRASMAATDALMKIGGGWGLPSRGSSGDAHVLINGQEVTNKLLEDIRKNTLKKGTTWL